MHFKAISVFYMLKDKAFVGKLYSVVVTSRMAASSTVNVTVSQGTLRGTHLTATSFSKKKYFAFKGIPYAQAPVGNLRFKDPRPPLPWDGVRDASQEAPSCPQKHVVLRDMMGEEDNCLALNVYTPKLPSEGGQKLPVMVWIHGGGFTFGSGNADMHDPDYWMERDVVIVTCNYRVGVLGFLSLGNATVPGNAGLKDQVMVLRWVRNNIAQFAGDPNNVTLFGESAGAASVHYHLLSPMSRGLFHRAIMMSGSCLNTWAWQEGRDRGFRLAEALGHQTSDSDKLLTFLQSVDVFDLVKAQGKVITTEEKQNMKVFPFTPCVEPCEGEGERFLTEQPRSLLQRGEIAAVPVIFGATDKEGILVLNDIPHSDEYFRVLNGNFSRIVPKELGLPASAPEKIKQFFFADKPVSWETLSEYMDYFGDLFFYVGIDEAVKLHVACNVAPVYCYSLTFDGQFGFLSYFIRLLYPQANIRGVCHADDIGYIFKYNVPGPPQMTDLVADAPEVQMVAQITGLWHQFASTGSPNTPGQSVQWEPVVGEGSTWRNYLELNVPPRMTHERLAHRRMEFWETMLRPHSNL